MTALSVRIHSKRFGAGAPVLQDLHFKAQAGEFVAIVGPSGAGKTTLLKVISGLECDFSGAVETSTDVRTALVFQEPRLMPWLTVAQNLCLVAPALSAQRVQALLASVNLHDCAARFPGQLSGGMQRRVALLRAFIVQPNLLLMDEPFQSLDAPTAQQLRTLLMDLWQQARPTVVFVTHSLPEALALADRVLFLSTGPSSVVLDYAVPTPRSGDLTSAAVMALQQDLLSQHPLLLQGAIGPGVAPAN
jgi:NitT/TauT family transport system ATP-binding protein